MFLSSIFPTFLIQFCLIFGILMFCIILIFGIYYFFNYFFGLISQPAHPTAFKILFYFYKTFLWRIPKKIVSEILSKKRKETLRANVFSDDEKKIDEMFMFITNIMSLSCIRKWHVKLFQYYFVTQKHNLILKYNWKFNLLNIFKYFCSEMFSNLNQTKWLLVKSIHLFFLLMVEQSK